MGRSIKIFGAALICLMALAGAASAHHSFAMFDQKKIVELKGTVKEFQWTNPHAFIEIEVAPQAGGPPETWSVEMNSPNNLTRQGWKSTALKPGDKVTVVMNPLRDGSRGGLFVSVMLPDGKVLGDPTRLPGTATNPGAKPG